MIQIRAWQVEACQGNLCAAALLNFFEYWHTNKLDQQKQAKSLNDVAEKHGDPRHQDESLLQWHNTQELQKGILGLYGESVIQKSVKFLESLGFISIHKNPNSEYKWDKTHYYLFHPEHVIAWLRANRDVEMDDSPQTPVITDAVEIRHRESKNTASMPQEYGIDEGKNTAAITEITTEITTEKLKDPTPTSPTKTPKARPKKPSSQQPIPVWSDDLTWPDPYSLVALYHDRKPKHWSAVSTISDSRLRKLVEYLAQFQEQSFWERVFAELHVPWSFELRSNNCTMDWLLQKGKNDQIENCLKVSEGRYRQQGSPKKRLELKL